eukprot:scaffold8783_cov24-Tisochrysis_lutea.AAC.1
MTRWRLKSKAFHASMHPYMCVPGYVPVENLGSASSLKRARPYSFGMPFCFLPSTEGCSSSLPYEKTSQEKKRKANLCLQPGCGLHQHAQQT